MPVRVSICSGFCGSANSIRPRSRTGLNVTMRQPRRAAACNGCRKRGLLLPVFCPKNRIMSQRSKSSSVQVPTDEPMTSFRPTDVVSWHMFELSGRLLCP